MWIATPPAMTACYETTLLKYTDNILSIRSGFQDICHCYGGGVLLQSMTMSVLITELNQSLFSSLWALNYSFL